MHVDVIELLRCPADHEESALVASAARQIDRRITHGTLGCPVCGAEYSVRFGVVDLRRDPIASAEHDAPAPEAAPNEDAVVRLAAQLDLTEPGRLLLLAGEYRTRAAALSVMFDARCIVVVVAESAERGIAEHASVLRVDTKVPLARASLHGVAIDATFSRRLGLQQVSSLLRPRGRLVAPATTSLPANVKELARDGNECVAARLASTSDVVPLKRAAR